MPEVLHEATTSAQTVDDPKSATEVAYCSWREEGAHLVLYEDDVIAVFSGVKDALRSVEELQYHSHDRDTIYAVLTTAHAVNDIFGEHGIRQISLQKGQCGAYTFEDGRLPYVHRMCSPDSLLGFLCVELTFALPRHGVKRPDVHYTHGLLKEQNSFSTAAEIVVHAGCTIHLKKRADVPPVRTIVVPLQPPTEKINVTFENGTQVEYVKDERCAHLVHALVAKNQDGRLVSHGTFVVENNSDADWSAIIMDIWQQDKNPSNTTACDHREAQQ